MNTNSTIIIRSTNERTYDICFKLVKNQIPENQIFTITETPFIKAVKRTFEIGLDNNNEYTLAIDADVLLTDNAVIKMTTQFDTLKEPTFILQGYVLDKLYGKYRQGGPHLYKTELLKKALKALKKFDESTHRPESSVYSELVAAGYTTQVIPNIYGLHDYEQYYGDIYRKAFFHAVKHREKNILSNMLKHWSKSITTDKDFQVALYGASHGLLYEGQAKPDINFFNMISASTFNSLNIKEKAPLSIEQLTDINSILSEYDTIHTHAKKSLKNITIGKNRKKKKSNLTMLDKLSNKLSKELIKAGEKLSRKN